MQDPFRKRAEFLRAAPSVLAPLALLVFGCSDPRGQFLQGRLEDTCNDSFPVCATTAGCLLGSQSYSLGRFPGDGKIIVQLTEPSTVALSFYLDSVASAGNLTRLTFNEAGCRGQTAVNVTGLDFTSEAEKLGFFTRQADLATLGDHLLEFNSDSEASYAVKVDVTPLRTAQ